MANSVERVNVSVIGEHAKPDKKFTPAVKVFGCRLDLPSGFMFHPDINYGVMKLSFHVFRNSFNRVRTVCYGDFIRSKEWDRKVLDIYGEVDFEKEVGERKIEVAGVAKLHPRFPEEFDVLVGIRKSFDKAFNMFMSSRLCGYKNTRDYREKTWERFEKILTENFYVAEPNAYGVWTPNWAGDRKNIYIISNSALEDLLSGLVEE